MKLKRVQIQNFRSIVDSGVVNIEEGVTVVIGKNEQGKTTFLKGIRAFNEDQVFGPGDLPNHLRPSLEEKPPAAIPVVTLWFGLEKHDKKRLVGLVVDAKMATELKCTKSYGNTYAYALISESVEQPVKFAAPEISKQAERIRLTLMDVRSKLHGHAERLPAFAANIEKIDQLTGPLSLINFIDPSSIGDLVKTFTASMKALTAQDQTVLDDIATATAELEASASEIAAIYQKDDRDRALRQCLPFFIFHSTNTDRIPNDVNVSEFVKDPESVSTGMSNLCRVAGLSIQKIKDLASTTDAPHREAYEDHYKAHISGGLNEFWTQAEYNVHFRIEREQLFVSISDGNYSRKIPPSDRSEGFQWYLSFYTALLNEMKSSNQTILLLDNPGLELHVDGQKDIKRFLEEKVAHDSQVIYVTHSPAMIDAFNLKQVRSVELQGNLAGTRISNSVLPQPGVMDLLEPVRSAIGMSLAASLVLNEWNVLVEGAADKPIVEGIFFEHYREHREKVLVNGSLSESKDAFLARFYERTKLPYVILLDADSGGRDLYRELRTYEIPDSKIIRLEDAFPDRGTDFELEDVLGAGFYHTAVQGAYPSLEFELPPIGGRKRTTLYAQKFSETHQIGFNKRRVAEVVKKLLENRAEDSETRENLGRLSTAIIQKLKAQVATGPPIEDATLKPKA